MRFRRLRGRGVAFGEAAFVDACTVSRLSVNGIGLMDIPGAKDEDGGGCHETWGINLRGVCVENVGQRRVGRGWRERRIEVDGREEDGVEEKENRPSKGGDPKSVVMPVECSWDHVIRNVPKNDLCYLYSIKIDSSLATGANQPKGAEENSLRGNALPSDVY